MPDMRLIVVGAGGRMGRALVKAIAETEGVALAGAVEQAGGLIGQDSGVLARLAANQLPLGSDPKPLIADAHGLPHFTPPAPTPALHPLCPPARTPHVPPPTPP